MFLFSLSRITMPGLFLGMVFILFIIITIIFIINLSILLLLKPCSIAEQRE